MKVCVNIVATRPAFLLKFKMPIAVEPSTKILLEKDGKCTILNPLSLTFRGQPLNRGHPNCPLQRGSTV